MLCSKLHSKKCWSQNSSSGYLEFILSTPKLYYSLRILCQVEGPAYAKALSRHGVEFLGQEVQMAGSEQTWSRVSAGQARLCTRLINLGTERCFKHRLT